jgi:peptidoglycan hydrolase-like protein with peptidoglycan-binding domain
MITNRCSRRNFLGAFAASIAAFTLSPPAQAGDAASQMQTSENIEQQKRLIRRVQSALQKKGFDPGPIDGVLGSKTSSALSDFQKSQGLEQTGGLGPKTLRALLGG